MTAAERAQAIGQTLSHVASMAAAEAAAQQRAVTAEQDCKALQRELQGAHGQNAVLREQNSAVTQEMARGGPPPPVSCTLGPAPDPAVILPHPAWPHSSPSRSQIFRHRIGGQRDPDLLTLPHRCHAADGPACSQGPGGGGPQSGAEGKISGGGAAEGNPCPARLTVWLNETNVASMWACGPCAFFQHRCLSHAGGLLAPLCGSVW